MNPHLINFTTAVPVEKTVGEIQSMLAKVGALRVMTEYGPTGIISAISFQVACPQVLSFRLPANTTAVHRLLSSKPGLAARYRNHLHAERVAWRIIKDWLSAQLSIISSSMVSVDQVFLPFAQVRRGETVYEAMKAEGFSQLLLPPAS